MSDDIAGPVTTQLVGDSRTAGFAWTGSGALLLAAMSVLVRASGAFGGVTAFHTTFFRFLIGGLGVGGYLVARGEPVRIVDWRMVVARGVLGAVVAFIAFYTINEIGLMKGSVLSFTYPAWAVMFAPMVLGERVPASTWVAVVAAFAGVYLVIAPGADWSGVAWVDLLALFGGMVGGLSVLIAKRVRETNSAATTFLSLAVFSVAWTIVPGTHGLGSLPPAGWATLLGIGLTGLAGKVMTEYALKLIRGSEAAIWALLVPIVSGVFGVLLFHEPMSALGLVGSLLVVSSCGYVAAGRRHVRVPATGVLR